MSMVMNQRAYWWGNTINLIANRDRFCYSNYHNSFVEHSSNTRWPRSFIFSQVYCMLQSIRYRRC